MSSTLQPMGDIAPIADAAKDNSTNDPLQKEYEEGKKSLENQEYGQAAVCLHNALVGFEENNNQSGIANASNQLGHLCLAREDYEKALLHYQKALKICDMSNDRMSVIAVLHKIIEAHEGLAQYDKAVNTCLDLLDHYHDNRNPQGTVDTLEKMAALYEASDLREKAADAYMTISSIHKNFGHRNSAAEYQKKAAELVAK